MEQHSQAYCQSLASNFAEVVQLTPVLSSAGQNWQPIQVMQFHHAFRELTLQPFANHVVTIYLGKPIQIVQKINGQTHERCLNPGNISLIPAGVSSEWVWKQSSGVDILHLYLNPAFVCQIAEANDCCSDQIAIANYLGISDLQIQHIGLALKAELETGCLSGSLYAEALATALAIRLLKHYSVLSERPTLLKNLSTVSRHNLEAVTHYIEDHLAADLTLASLASQMRVSPSHFVYLFKRSLGLTPHQYVIQRRIEQAKQLLWHGELSISEVATQVGFADQSHLNRHFKRLTGRTPKAFLANRKNVL